MNAVRTAVATIGVVAVITFVVALHRIAPLIVELVLS